MKRDEAFKLYSQLSKIIRERRGAEVEVFTKDGLKVLVNIKIEFGLSLVPVEFEEEELAEG
jgi:hypothetical protein